MKVIVEPPAPTASGRLAGVEGLSSEEARLRLRRDGPNLLPPPPALPMWRRVAEQLVHFFALMLWAAGGLAFVAGLPQLGIAIFVVVVVNGAFSFVQEYRADRAAEHLRRLLPHRVLVVRDGLPVEVDARDVVAGDLMTLGGGDKVAADARLVTAHSLAVDASTLTGESVPVPSGVGDAVFAGTFVSEGEGAALVTATGAGTRLAGIAALARSVDRPRPPLTVELHRLVQTVALIAVCVGATFFGVSLLLGTPATDGFVLAIGVTVALVPEGLLPTVTLSLAIGAQRMARHHALVRRLDAVETLGSTTFICTDKTGTLTFNQMTVVEAWTPQGTCRVRGSGYGPAADVDVAEEARHALARLAVAGARTSRGLPVLEGGAWVARGDPMEAALHAFATRIEADVEHDLVARPERIRFPFDPRRRRMSVVAGSYVLVKGAPDAVLPLCSGAPGAEESVVSMSERGLRVLAVAERTLDPATPASSVDEFEQDLELLGVLGLEDPPRVEAAASIAACRRAGIRVAMITGDHPSTAAAIAREVGLVHGAERVLTGADLPADDAALGELVDYDGAVVARVDPEEKLRIARALRARGHVLAMTGDGVNDGPALEEADIGIAMGRSGTDVAREAADLVLLDDDFGTIVTAVEQGRSIFSNVQRFLTYHLTDNVAEMTPFMVWALSGGRFPLALGVLQILALDIGTDTASAVALGAERPVAGLLDRPPTRARLLDRTVAARAFGVLGPVEAAMAMAAFVVSMIAAGWRPGEAWPSGATAATASGAAFAAVVIGQTANAFACRSTHHSPWAIGWLSNRVLAVAAAVELAVTAAFLFLPSVASALEHAAPSAAGWAVAVAAAPAVLLADAAYKRRRRRRMRSEGHSAAD